MTDDEKAMHVSIAIGALETVRSAEYDIKPKSARSLALANLIDNSLRVLDMYRANAWVDSKRTKAAYVLDAIERMISRSFGAVVEKPLVGRDSTNGRFVKLGGEE